MKLRYRLFIWVAGIFFLAFSVSFFLEDRITRISLGNTYNELLSDLRNLNVKKTKEIEEYISDLLFQAQAKVDTVLKSVEQFKSVRKGFEPNLRNLKEMNWLDAASLIVTNKWIHFIQSTNEESIMSQIIIDRNNLHESLIFQINEDLTLIAFKHENGEWSKPFIGIEMNITSDNLFQGNKHDEADEDYLAFFTLESLLNLNPNTDHESIDISINFLEPYIKWVDVPYKVYYFQDFIEKIKKTKKYLQANVEAIPDDLSWQKMISQREKVIEKQGLTACYNYGSKKNKFGQIDSRDFEISRNFSMSIQHYLSEFVMFYKKVGLIWGLSMLTHSDIFGDSPLSSSSPYGFCNVNIKGLCIKSDMPFFGNKRLLIN